MLKLTVPWQKRTVKVNEQKRPKSVDLSVLKVLTCHSRGWRAQNLLARCGLLKDLKHPMGLVYISDHVSKYIKIYMDQKRLTFFLSFHKSRLLPIFLFPQKKKNRISTLSLYCWDILNSWITLLAGWNFWRFSIIPALSVLQNSCCMYCHSNISKSSNLHGTGLFCLNRD